MYLCCHPISVVTAFSVKSLSVSRGGLLQSRGRCAYSCGKTLLLFSKSKIAEREKTNEGAFPPLLVIRFGLLEPDIQGFLVIGKCSSLARCSGSDSFVAHQLDVSITFHLSCTRPPLTRPRWSPLLTTWPSWIHPGQLEINFLPFRFGTFFCFCFLTDTHIVSNEEQLFLKSTQNLPALCL